MKLSTKVTTPDGPQDWYARIIGDDIVLSVPPSNFEINPITGSSLVTIPKEAFLNLGMRIPE